eukprot:6315863-Prymnesium_polylepis.1
MPPSLEVAAMHFDVLTSRGRAFCVTLPSAHQPPFTTVAARAPAGVLPAEEQRERERGVSAARTLAPPPRPSVDRGN